MLSDMFYVFRRSFMRRTSTEFARAEHEGMACVANFDVCCVFFLRMSSSFGIFVFAVHYPLEDDTAPCFF